MGGGWVDGMQQRQQPARDAMALGGPGRERTSAGLEVELQATRHHDDDDDDDADDGDNVDVRWA